MHANKLAPKQNAYHLQDFYCLNDIEFNKYFKQKQKTKLQYKFERYVLMIWSQRTIYIMMFR